MDECHVIILYMYYINPDNDPQKISYWKISKSIDITQLLLVTEGAFGISQYEFFFESNKKKIDIVAVNKYRGYYDSMVAKTQDVYLKEAHIIIDFSTSEYPDFFRSAIWVKKPLEQRKIIYRLNVLINSINAMNNVPERCSKAEYCLFSEKGYFFIKYLSYLLEIIINKILIENSVSISDMIQLINIGYNHLKTVYNNRSIIIEDLRNRESIDKSYYEMMEESIEFGKWLDYKSKSNQNDPTMFYFIFHDAYRKKQQAMFLLTHIIDILDVLSDGTRELIMWEDEPGGIRMHNCAQFKKLSDIFVILKENYKKLKFKKEMWAKEYLSEMKNVTDS